MSAKSGEGRGRCGGREDGGGIGRRGEVDDDASKWKERGGGGHRGR